MLELTLMLLISLTSGPKKYHRSKSKKLCNSLERIFGKDGCKSHESKYAVTAIIDIQAL